MYLTGKNAIHDFSKMDLDELYKRLDIVNKALSKLNTDTGSPISFQEGGYRLILKQLNTEIDKRGTPDMEPQTRRSSSSI